VLQRPHHGDQLHDHHHPLLLLLLVVVTVWLLG